MRTAYKHKFDRIVFNNRWAKPFWHRSDDWTIIGIRKHWFGRNEYEYTISFFGLDIRIWMIREAIGNLGVPRARHPLPPPPAKS